MNITGRLSAQGEDVSIGDQSGDSDVTLTHLKRASISSRIALGERSGLKVRRTAAPLAMRKKSRNVKGTAALPKTYFRFMPPLQSRRMSVIALRSSFAILVEVLWHTTGSVLIRTGTSGSVVARRHPVKAGHLALCSSSKLCRKTIANFFAYHHATVSSNAAIFTGGLRRRKPSPRPTPDLSGKGLRPGLSIDS